MYTKEQLLIAKDVLQGLISDDRKITDIDQGICWNAFLNSRYAMNIQDGLFEYTLDYGKWVSLITNFVYEWQHYSGFVYIPVPDEDGCGKWEGNNLLMRIDLMRHIINKIDTMLEEM